MSKLDINEYISANYEEFTDLQLATKLGISPKAVRERRRRMGLRKGGASETVELTSDSEATTLEKLLEKNGVSFGDIATVKLSSWSQKPKDDEKVDLDSASVTLRVDKSKASGPAWPVIQPAAPVNFERAKAKVSQSKNKVAVIFPDPQIGFRRNLRNGRLDPFHDEKAMAVALTIARDLDPDLIVNLGDFMDFAMFGRFDQEPGFQVTAQAGIDRGHSFLAEQVEITDKVVLLEGNHDVRLQKYITKNAMAAFGLTKANCPDDWPVLSLQNLLRLEELGVEYVDGYPNGEYYINDRLRCEHGSKHAPRGKIAAKIVGDENVSIITGHMHRIESVYKTTATRKGPKVSLGMTLGCLCRTDGAVPSTKTAIDARGNPVLGQMDWQQAIGVVEYVEGDGPFNITPVLIQDGEAMFGNTLYQA